jgi:ribosomal subunit interface protein
LKHFSKHSEGEQMTIQVTGKNISAGEAFSAYVSDKISDILTKYIGPELSGHVRVEKERGRFLTNCTVRLRTGLVLEAHGEGADAYGSADTALEKLEKRVRRYKRRLKNHHSGSTASAPQSPATHYVLQRDEQEDVADSDDHPAIIAETAEPMRAMSVSEAVMQLDLTDTPFFVFRSAANGEVNVVYRRADGNIGWIDPGLGATGSAKAASA